MQQRAFERDYLLHSEAQVAKGKQPLEYEDWLRSFYLDIYHEIANMRHFVRTFAPKSNTLQTSAKILESLDVETKRMKDEQKDRKAAQQNTAA